MYGDIARASTWGKQRAAGRWQLAETRKSQALPAACCLLVAVALALPMSLSMLILEAATRKHWHMATEFREYDEHGFPLPPRFESVQYQDDEPRRRPKINLKAKRLVLIALVVGLIVPTVFGPQLISAGRGMVSRWFTSRAERRLLAGDLPGAARREPGDLLESRRFGIAIFAPCGAAR